MYKYFAKGCYRGTEAENSLPIRACSGDYDDTEYFSFVEGIMIRMDSYKPRIVNTLNYILYSVCTTLANPHMRTIGQY